MHENDSQRNGCPGDDPRFSPELLGHQDLSKYRDFAFGANLSSISKKLDRQPAEAEVIHQKPELIQELTWWSSRPYPSDPDASSSKILFSFYNGALYRILATYDNSAIVGLTDEDMIQALSARYGTAARPVASGLPYEPQLPGYRESDRTVGGRPIFAEPFRSSLDSTFAIVHVCKTNGRASGLSIADSMGRDNAAAGQ